MTTENYGVTSKETGTADREAEITDSKPGAADVKHALIYYLRLMGLSVLCFLGILALLIPVGNLLIIITNALGLFDHSELLPPSLLFGMFVNSSTVFLLVLGIVMPTYLETMLNFGLTRKQNTYALLLASLLVAFALTLVSVLAAMLFGGFDPLGSILRFVIGWLSYLLGWFIVIGYQYRRVLTAFASTAVGIALVFSGIAPFPLLPTALGMEENVLLSTGIPLLFSLVLVLAIIPLTSRIPIKV